MALLGTMYCCRGAVVQLCFAPSNMILFLDYDGVLHPHDVYLERGKPVLHQPGELFMWAPILADIVSPYPDLSIVLSTSWVRRLRFDRAKSYLPELLRVRVIGAAWHSSMGRHPEAAHRIESWFVKASRFEQIAHYVACSSSTDWLAIDDDDYGWRESERHRLIRTDQNKGLSEVAVQQDLRSKLKRAHSASLQAT